MRKNIGNKISAKNGKISGEIVGVDLPASRSSRYLVKLDKDYMHFKPGEIIAVYRDQMDG